MVRVVNGKIVSDDDHGSSSAYSSGSSGGGWASAASGAPSGSQPMQVLGVLALFYFLFGGSGVGSLLKYPLMAAVLYMALSAANSPRVSSAPGRGGGGGWNVR